MNGQKICQICLLIWILKSFLFESKQKTSTNDEPHFASKVRWLSKSFVCFWPDECQSEFVIYKRTGCFCLNFQKSFWEYKGFYSLWPRKMRHIMQIDKCEWSKSDSVFRLWRKRCFGFFFFFLKNLRTALVVSEKKLSSDKTASDFDELIGLVVELMTVLQHSTGHGFDSRWHCSFNKKN
jgi:hypothetical protein